MKTQVKARIAGSIFFLICGSAMAIFAVHIPAIEAKIQINHATLGSLLLLLGAGAFAAMELTGRLVDRLGSRRVTSWSGILVSLVLFGPGFADSTFTLGLAIFALGFGIGALDASMNAHALNVERAYSRPIFSSFHAYFSVGGLVGSGLGALTLSFGLGVSITLPLLGTLLLVTSLIFAGWLLPDAPKQTVSKSTAASTSRLTLGFVLLLGALSGFAAMAEGSAGDWSALEFTSILQTSQATAAFGLASFSLTMFTARLLIDRVVARFGRMAVIRWGSLVASFGMSLAVLAINVPMTLLGWGILGLGASGIVPQFFALVDEASEVSARGRNVSRVLAMTYLGILAGPALVGWLTIWLPLNLALGLCAALLLVIFVSSFRLKVSQ